MELLQRCIFITGTDTDAGKTYVTKQLITFFNSVGIQTIAIKPLASGADQLDPMNNEDIATLSLCQGVQPNDINRLLFEAPSAPNILANEQSFILNNQVFHEAVQHILKQRFAHKKFQLCLIEGVGGWKLPMSADETLDEWVIENKIPILQVVGMRLGCMNHSLLTADAIERQGVNHLGWIANQIDPQLLYYNETLKTLKQHLKPPFIGETPHNRSIVFKEPEAFLKRVQQYLNLY